MHALFPEDSLRLFHRVSLEMAFADNFLAAQRRGTQPVREIIQLDDDDEEMGDGSQVNVTAGEWLVYVFLLSSILCILVCMFLILA